MLLPARKSVLVLSIIVAIIITIGTSTVFAQERAGEILQQLEKKDLVPRNVPEATIIQEKKAEEKQQPILSGQKILIKQIKVTIQNKTQAEATPLLAPEKIRSITSKYENKELTLSEINQIADEITASYRSQGYILVYAFIPEQEIKEGVLEIGMIEGKIGTITVTGNESYSSNFIQKHLQKIEKDKSLKEETLERSLIILNEYTSLNVKASLKAGKELGVTDIIAETKDSLPVSGSLSYDNFGLETTSKNRLSAEFNIGNILTSGDLLMLRGITGLDNIDIEKLSYGRVEYLIPIAYSGTKAGLYYTGSLDKSGKEYAALDIHGEAQVGGIYITHPIIKTRDKALDVKFGFDYKDIYDYMLGALRSKDDIRVFNLGMTYNFIDGFYGRNIINLTYYQGVRDILGGNGAHDSDASRLNADGAFSKGTADFIRIQKLPGYNHLLLKASGQLSGDSLFSAEQFILGGAGSVRGFAPSLQSGDSGYSVSAELYLSPLFPEANIFNQKLGDTLKFVLFIDHGGVFRNDVQPGEDKRDYLTGIGAGIRLYAGKYFSARFDYAVPYINGGYDADNSEIYVQVAVGF